MKVLCVHLLGAFGVAYGDQPVTTVNTARMQSLLAYLILHRDAPQSRSHLAFQFWPNSSESQAYTNLRKLFHQLHHALPDADRFLCAGARALQWQPDAPFTLDVAEFENLAGQTASPQALREAVAIYRGDLLQGCYDDWILFERERLRQMLAETLERLIALLESGGDYRAAIQYAQRLLYLDPLHEAAYRSLIRLHALSGDRAGVVRTYHTCVRMLQRELDIEPGIKTYEAYEQGLEMAAAGRPVSDDGLVVRMDNLPPLLTRFIGRKRESEQVRQLVLAHRLVTLTGVGGIGKTQLALAVAGELVRTFADGVWYVELGALADPALVVSAVAAVLGVRNEGERPLLAQLTGYLGAKRLLLILDNCEHLAANIRVLIDELLRAAPGLQILATSREVLGVRGEVTYRVLPLDVPEMEPGVHERQAFTQDQLGEIAQCDSVQLFCDRVSAILPTFELSAENARFVAGICRQLEGLPLAIELAAARMNVLSAEQIHQRLGEALSLLTRGSSVALPHQQTLQATLEWGYGLLSEAERALFRRLAVFTASFSLEAAESICDIPPAAVLDLLSNLVDKSLVEPLPTARAMRYRLLEVVRQFAYARLCDAGEEQPLRCRHRDYFLQWAEHGEAELRGAQQLEWFARFESEHDNLCAAMEWCQQDADAEKGLRLASALWWFWRVRGYLSKGRARMAKMLALPAAPVNTAVRARALNVAGFLALFQGDFPAARQYAQEALAIAEELDDRQAMAMALYTLGDNVVAGSVERGMAIRQQSLALSEASGDKWMMAFTLNALGELARLQDDYAAAGSFYERSLQLRRELQDKRGIAVCLTNLGFVVFRQGQIEQARELLRHVLAARWDLRDTIGVAETLVGMVGVIVESGDRDAIYRAARWLGSLSAQLDNIWTPLTGADRREFEAVTACACLSGRGRSATCAGGRTTTIARTRGGRCPGKLPTPPIIPQATLQATL